MATRCGGLIQKLLKCSNVVKDGESTQTGNRLWFEQFIDQTTKPSHSHSTVSTIEYGNDYFTLPLQPCHFVYVGCIKGAVPRAAIPELNVGSIP